MTTWTWTSTIGPALQAVDTPLARDQTRRTNPCPVSIERKVRADPRASAVAHTSLPASKARTRSPEDDADNESGASSPSTLARIPADASPSAPPQAPARYPHRQVPHPPLHLPIFVRRPHPHTTASTHSIHPLRGWLGLRRRARSRARVRVRRRRLRANVQIPGRFLEAHGATRAGDDEAWGRGGSATRGRGMVRRGGGGWRGAGARSGKWHALGVVYIACSR